MEQQQRRRADFVVFVGVIEELPMCGARGLASRQRHNQETFSAKNWARRSVTRRLVDEGPMSVCTWEPSRHVGQPVPFGRTLGRSASVDRPRDGGKIGQMIGMKP